MSGNGEGVYVNGVLSAARTGTTNFTAYISPYLVVNNGGIYSKHIYIGSQRIVSKLGSSDIFYNGNTVNNNKAPIDPLVPKAGSKDFTAKYTDLTAKIKTRYDSLGMVYGGTAQYSGLTTSSSGRIPIPLQYYYHCDHLGSSSLITDASGAMVQHLEYIPFGEVFIEEKNNIWNTPYKFNAKELDEETGLYYYGARYYDPKTSVWISVDPLAEKYYSISPYAYCAGNPVRYMDIKGEYLVDSNGSRIYKNGKWNDNASIGSMRIGNAMLATPTGRSDFNLLVKADYPVTLNLTPGKNDIANADVDIKEQTTTIDNVVVSKKIISVDINISEGNATEILDQLNDLKAGKITVSGLSDSDKARVNNMPKTVDEIIGQKASHEVGHVRQSTQVNKSDKKEEYPIKREIKTINETPDYRLEKIPTPVVGI